MPSATDTAQYILEQFGPMTTMKLQKLIFYCQAWSMVWDDEIIFPDSIEAWENGPVVRELWDRTRGRYKIDSIPNANPNTLSDAQKETVSKVLTFYGDKDAQWLSDLTHMEAPWDEAFAQGKNTEISLERMMEYYSSLPPPDVKAGS